MDSNSFCDSPNGEPRRNMPLTSLISEILPSASAPPQRSIAMVKARRTRSSSNGFFSVLKASWMLVIHVPVWTVTLSPSALTSWSRSDGVRPRNSASNWPLWMPGTTAEALTKNAL